MRDEIQRSERLQRDLAKLNEIGRQLTEYQKGIDSGISPEEAARRVFGGSDINLAEAERLLGDNFFGVKQYKELLGVEVRNVPLVDLTRDYLESLCPVKNDGKTKVFASNVALVLVPDLIDGRPATLQSLAPIINAAGRRLGRSGEATEQQKVIWPSSWGLTDGKENHVYSSLKGSVTK